MSGPERDAMFGKVLKWADKFLVELWLIFYGSHGEKATEYMIDRHAENNLWVVRDKMEEIEHLARSHPKFKEAQDRYLKEQAEKEEDRRKKLEAKESASKNEK